jgi:ATP-dependent protease ClpP protease subunit
MDKSSVSSQAVADESQRPASDRLLFQPNISINGVISDETLSFFLGRMEAVRSAGEDMIMELNTNGGDADVARRIALEVRLFLRRSGRRACCVGKTKIYSAGVTILAAFPKECRFLTDDAVLLVHERRIDDNIVLKGPMKSCIQIVKEQLALLETAERLEMEGFRELVEGSALTTDELYDRATKNCYIHAEEAFKTGLVAQILR